MNIYTDFNKIVEPKLDKQQYYIYVLLNSYNRIKIGITHQITKRVYSLSNSNAGGAKLVKIAISQPTYLRTLEDILHRHYNDYRVPNTEWFIGLQFDDVVKFVESLFQQKNYNEMNETRKQLGGYKKHFIYKKVKNEEEGK